MISCHHFRKNVTQKSDDLTISTGILTLVTVDDTPFLNLYPQTNQTLEIIREQSTIPTDVIPIFLIPLDSIENLVILPCLTVVGRKPSSIVKVSFNSEGEGWFDPIDHVQATKNDVVEMLKKWFSIFKLDLIERNLTTGVYDVVEMRWPKELPMPKKDSVVGRVGEMGLGFVGAILGSPAKNVSSWRCNLQRFPS